RARSSTADFRLEEEGPEIPVLRPRKDEMAEPLKSQIEAQDKLDRQEHWRLLYVAMTRAEERLYIGGSLGPADKKGPPEDSWFTAARISLGGLGSDWEEDPLWVSAMRHGEAEIPAKAAAAPEKAEIRLPDWARQPAPVETRPPRPLAPSSIGEDDVVDPPPSPALREAALRGKLLHQLFERLPAVPEDQRSGLADRWLERSAGIADPELRRSLIHDACSIIADPLYAELFSPAALAEAPIAAVTEEGVVVAGTVDRLLVTDERILVVDFKTGRKAPETTAEIPAAHLRQMAAYTSALQVIFPGRAVEAALLYTAAPVLHPLPSSLLERFRTAG
ncbi:MAG TPA: PD-(D/E)XK nuclease family protein, partial [Allosphingosinicella sp.]|nr:PD-(D/E)XK nuclease family protein [Allosphingosinicella sp.]